MKNWPLLISNMMGGVRRKRRRYENSYKIDTGNIKIREQLRRTRRKRKYNIKMYFKDAECEEVD